MWEGNGRKAVPYPDFLETFSAAASNAIGCRRIILGSKAFDHVSPTRRAETNIVRLAEDR